MPHRSLDHKSNPKNSLIPSSARSSNCLGAGLGFLSSPYNCGNDAQGYAPLLSQVSSRAFMGPFFTAGGGTKMGTGWEANWNQDLSFLLAIVRYRQPTSRSPKYRCAWKEYEFSLPPVHIHPKHAYLGPLNHNWKIRSNRTVLAASPVLQDAHLDCLTHYQWNQK